MSSAQTPVFLANQTKVFDHLIPFHKPLISCRSSASQSFPMWRNIAKQTISRSQARLTVASQSRGFPQESVFSKDFKFRFPGFGSLSSSGCREMGVRRFTRPAEEFSGRVGLNDSCFNGSFARGYTSVAEEVSSTDVEEEPSVADEVQELLKEMKKEKKREDHRSWRMRKQQHMGMSNSTYRNLWRRQVKIETEEWERAAAEYGELLTDMCEQKLAPNLPYVKSLFLGWFEPLRDAIVKEQELFRLGKSKAVYAHYLDQLPADMVAVITMHKLMGHLMTGGDNGCVKVVHAACSVGDAIEQEVG